MNKGIKSSWPETEFKSTGGFTRAKRVREIENERKFRENRATAAEMIAAERRKARAESKRRAERARVAKFFLDNQTVKGKVRTLKGGTLAVQPIRGGKFQKAIAV